MSRNPLPLLLDMPYHIKKEITENLHQYTDKIALKHCNTEFHRLIGNPTAHLDRFEFFCDNRRLEIQQNGKTFSLTFFPCSRLHCNVINNVTRRRKMTFWRSAPQLAADHFKKFLENPNLIIGSFRFKVSRETDDVFLEKLLSSIGMLKVERLEFPHFGKHEALLQVLPHLDVGVLKTMDVCIGEQTDLVDLVKLEFEKVIHLPQFQNLQKLELCSTLTSSLPIEHFLHIPVLNLTMESSLTQLTQLPVLIEHCRHSPTFRKCYIDTGFEEAEIVAAIGGDDEWVDFDQVKIRSYPVEWEGMEFDVVVDGDFISISANYDVGID